MLFSKRIASHMFWFEKKALRQYHWTENKLALPKIQYLNFPTQQHARTHPKQCTHARTHHKQSAQVHARTHGRGWSSSGSSGSWVEDGAEGRQSSRGPAAAGPRTANRHRSSSAYAIRRSSICNKLLAGEATDCSWPRRRTARAEGAEVFWFPCTETNIVSS